MEKTILQARVFWAEISKRADADLGAKPGVNPGVDIDPGVISVILYDSQSTGWSGPSMTWGSKAVQEHLTFSPDGAQEISWPLAEGKAEMTSCT